jgi:hypothetical protein
VRLSPSTETFAVTYVTVSGLAPLTAYTFQVYSENGVSKVSFPSRPARHPVLWIRIRELSA